MPKYVETDLHADAREVKGMPSDKSKRQAQRAKIAAQLKRGNTASGFVTADENGKNVHPERLTIHERNSKVYICRSDDARDALPKIEGRGRTAGTGLTVSDVFGE